MSERVNDPRICNGVLQTDGGEFCCDLPTGHIGSHISNGHSKDGVVYTVAWGDASPVHYLHGWKNYGVSLPQTFERTTTGDSCRYFIGNDGRRYRMLT